MWGGKGSKGGGGYGPMSGGDPWSSWGMGAWSKGAMMQQMAAMMSGPYGWGGMGGMGGMGGGGKGGRSGSFSTSDDPEKEALVSRVKQIQRAGDEEKEKWWQFCDAQNTGTRDPSRHNVDFLRRFLEAYESGDIHQAMARGGRGATVEKGESNVLRMRGLPFSCKPSQVIDFLADFDLDDSNVVFTSTADGRPSGEAYVLFHSPDDAERAYSEKQHQHLGSRYVEIFRASQDEWSQAKKAMSGGGGGVSRGVRGGGGRTSYPTLRLRGLPFSSGSMDVVNFFSDYGVEKADVVMGIGNDGRPSGEAFVIFRDDNAASRAMDEKQNEKMGTRYVEIFASSYDEWTKASNNRGGGGGGGGGGWGMMDPWSMMGFGPWGMGGGMSGWGGGGGGKGGRGGGGGGCSGDPQKDGLVQRVKSIQRSSPDAKEAWWSYCDNEGRGIRDPSRHEEAFLQRFLDQYG